MQQTSKGKMIIDVPPDGFFSCDWGTSSFRLRWVTLPGAHVGREMADTCGIASVQPQDGDRGPAFRSMLSARLAGMAGAAGLPPGCYPVAVSGMASSSVGWSELEYARVPFPLDGSRAVMRRIARLAVGGWSFDVHLISGVRTEADVMRGEETELIGLQACCPALSSLGEGVVVLPGTHSKHAVVRGGVMTDFSTFMTGELFEVLSLKTLLRFSVSFPPPEPDPAAIKAFRRGVAAAAADGIGSRLFSIRARSLLHGTPNLESTWFLSGLLHGAEVAALLDQHPRGPILLAGGRRFHRAYQWTCETLDAAERLITAPPSSSEAASIRGHAILLQQAASQSQISTG